MVNYEVDSAGTLPGGGAIPAGDYLYTYIVHNGGPQNQPGEPNIDYLAVDNAFLGGVVNTGNTAHLDVSSAQWFFDPLGLYANSTTLWLVSTYPPTENNASVADLVPPSPFASGGQVDVPNARLKITKNSSFSLPVLYNGSSVGVTVVNTSADHWVVTLPVAVLLNNAEADPGVAIPEPGAGNLGHCNNVFQTKGAAGPAFSTQLFVVSDSPTTDGLYGLVPNNTPTQVGITSTGIGLDLQFNDLGDGTSTVPDTANLGNLRASQRAGTTLVDVFYDLTGSGSSYAASPAVSSDAGASFTVSATHFTGDGVTSPTSPGTGLHIVWDAGADFPGQFSTRMRLQLAVNGAASAVSPIFTLDTRAVPTGTLTGHVQGNSAPVANAQVQLKGTVFSGNTDSSGAFTLNNVPAGSGYLVTVAAAGFASKQVPGVTVSAGTTDMGTIALAAVGGPCHLVALAPDVNPSTTTVEVGGTAYRYYLALNSANQPQGGVIVSAQVSGGNPIPQSGDVSAYWPGQTAGVSDADGIVRVSIPASALGALGVPQTVELSVAGQVQQTFQAEVALRQYDQVWRQKLGGGASVEVLPLLSLEGDTSGESEVRHTMVNGAVTAESISRIRTTKGQLSVGDDVGSSLSVSSASFNFSGGAEVGAEANGFLADELRSTYGFDPNTADQWQNAMKLYVDLGNVLNGVPGPAGAFYQFAEATVEPLFLGSSLQSVEGDVIVGGGLDLGGQVGFSVAGGSEQAQVGLQGGLSADMEGILGAEASFGAANDSAVVVGVAASGSAMAGGGISLGLARIIHKVSPAGRCSAGFQPAVSRISNPQTRPSRYSLPTGSRRYSRLETCATKPREPGTALRP